MNKEKTVVILAAGMGSRFGSLKQLEPVGPWGQLIIDYSVYDAKQAGFTKVVFVIKEENYHDFKDTIGKRVEGRLKVEYVFQKTEDLPQGFKFPERKKPWGTAHALRAARSVVNEPFILISADDFYGRDAFVKCSEFLDTVSNDDLNFATVVYPVKNTITQNGTVKRGLVYSDNNIVTNIIESVVRKDDDEMFASPLNVEEEKPIDPNTDASMLLFAFTPKVFDLIESNFANFLNDSRAEITTKEFLIPELLNNSIINNIIKVNRLQTTGNWYGVTYKEDKELVQNAIKNLIRDQVYSDKLWDKE